MKLYTLPGETILRQQCGDPLLRHLTDKIVRFLGTPPGRVLDVGCGSGRVAVELARRGFSVDALDVEQKVVEQARILATRCGVHASFFVADFQRVDPRFPEATYDAVVCSEVLEHVEPWRDVVANMARVLKPGGLLVVTTPNDPGQFSALDRYAGHIRRFRWEELSAGLSHFEILEAFTVGFPLTRGIHWVYTRLVQPLFFREHSPERLWRSGSWYAGLCSSAFYGAARLDDVFNGLRWGTTWVVKARKLETHGPEGARLAAPSLDQLARRGTALDAASDGNPEVTAIGTDVIARRGFLVPGLHAAALSSFASQKKKSAAVTTSRAGERRPYTPIPPPPIRTLRPGEPTPLPRLPE